MKQQLQQMTRYVALFTDRFVTMFRCFSLTKGRICISTLPNSSSQIVFPPGEYQEFLTETFPNVSFDIMKVIRKNFCIKLNQFCNLEMEWSYVPLSGKRRFEGLGRKERINAVFAFSRNSQAFKVSSFREALRRKESSNSLLGTQKLVIGSELFIEYISKLVVVEIIKLNIFKNLTYAPCPPKCIPRNVKSLNQRQPKSAEPQLTIRFLVTSRELWMLDCHILF